MPGRQDEAVAVGPVRVVAGRDAGFASRARRPSGHAHRRAGVPGIGLLDAVDRERPDRVDGEAVEGGAGESHEGCGSGTGRSEGREGSRESIGPRPFTAPPRAAPPACRRTERPGRRRRSPGGAAGLGRRLPGRLEPGRMARDRRRDGAGCHRAAETMFSCGSRDPWPEGVRYDPQPKVGHVERRVGGVGRDHQRDAQRRFAQQRPVRLDLELPDRLHPEAAAQLDRRVRPARRHDLPAASAAARDPRPQAVENEEREGIPAASRGGRRRRSAGAARGVARRGAAGGGRRSAARRSAGRGARFPGRRGSPAAVRC